MTAVLQEFVGLLVGGIQALATGIAQGANSMVSALFLDTSGTTPVLSTFGGVVAIFGKQNTAEVKSGKIGKNLSLDNTELKLVIA